MTQVIEGKEAVNKLGFVYEPNADWCTVHMFNDLPLELDLRGYFDSLENIEKDVDKAFLVVVAHELKDSGVIKLHSMAWEKIFLFPLWEPRWFEARYWVRIMGIDEIKFQYTHDLFGGYDPQHICRV